MSNLKFNLTEPEQKVIINYIEKRQEHLESMLNEQRKELKRMKKMIRTGKIKVNIKEDSFDSFGNVFHSIKYAEFDEVKILLKKEKGNKIPQKIMNRMNAVQQIAFKFEKAKAKIEKANRPF